MSARLLGRWPDRSPEWYAAREGRVGGSDIGVALGWSPYRTREDLITERIYGRKREEPNATAATRVKGGRRRGVYLEPAVLAWVSDRAEVEYDPERSTGTWVDAEHNWRMFNPDAVTRDGRLVEVKTCDVRDAEHDWGRALTDQVPLLYAAQVHWGLGVLGLDRCLLGVLSGAPRFEFALYKITFDPNVFAFLCRAAAGFLAELAAHPDFRKAAA